jgi:hypothetical protein
MAGQPISFDLPVLGGNDRAESIKVAEALTTLRLELERPVTPADMDVNGDISFLSAGTYSSIADIRSVRFRSGALLSASSYPASLYFGPAGELYANDEAGNQVQLTAGGAVNVATAGAIGSVGLPAYGTSGVEFRWNGSSSDYSALRGAGPDDYADLRCRAVFFNDGSSHFAKIQAPAVVADYTLTLPTLPGSTLPLTLSAAGVLATAASLSLTSLTTSGNVTGAGLVATSTGLNVTAGGANITGLATLNTGLTVTGAATFNNSMSTAGVVGVTGTHIRVQGTGRFKHDDMQCVVGMRDGVITAVGATTTAEYFSLPVPVGAVVKSVVARVASSGHGFGTGRTYTVTILTSTTANPPSSIGSVTVFENDTPVTQTIDVTDTTQATSRRWQVSISNNLAGGTINLYALTVTYDMP